MFRKFCVTILSFMILSLGIHSQTKGHKSNLKKSDIESAIIGQWTYQQDSVISSLRYIKTDSIHLKKED